MMVTDRATRAAKRLLKPTLERTKLGHTLLKNAASMSGGDVNERIAELMARNTQGNVPIGRDLGAGIRMDQDPQQERSLQICSPAGSVVHLQATQNSDSRWTALHFKLGGLDLSGIDVLGVVVQSQSRRSTALSRIALRSGNQHQFRDFFFEKHLASVQDGGLHIDICRLDDLEHQIPIAAEWRELIIFFPEKELDLTISKVRFISA